MPLNPFHFSWLRMLSFFSFRPSTVSEENSASDTFFILLTSESYLIFLMLDLPYLLLSFFESEFH